MNHAININKQTLHGRRRFHLRGSPAAVFMASWGITGSEALPAENLGLRDAGSPRGLFNIPSARGFGSPSTPRKETQ